MQLTKKQKIIISGIILVVLLGIYIAFDRKSVKEQEEFNVGENKALSTTTDKINSNTGGYKIEQIPIDEGKIIPQPVPDLTRKIIFSNDPSLTAEVKNSIEKKVSDLQEMLKKDPAYFEAWIDLGIYQKMAGDYKGTVISWIYASKLSPGSYLPLANLGNLYAYFLKDNAMSEVYYREAIARKSDESYLYYQLAEVYRDFFKDNVKALGIIEQGLSKIPNDPNLLYLKSTLTK